jgi:hypothetical protein
MANSIVAQICCNKTRLSESKQHFIVLAAEPGCGMATDSALVATIVLTMQQSDIVRVLGSPRPRRWLGSMTAGGSRSVPRESSPSEGMVQVAPFHPILNGSWITRTSDPRPENQPRPAKSRM